MLKYGSQQGGEYRPKFGGFSFFPPVIKNLLMVTVGVYILQFFFEGGLQFGGVPVFYWFRDTFYLNPIGHGFMPWQLVTYMFLHGNLHHIFLNMLMLWMFGMELENTWGSKKFLILYLAAGIIAGLANLFIAPLFSEAGRTIGASGGVYAVLVAFAMIFPNRHIYLYFFVPIRAKYLITFFILLEVFNGVSGTMDGIAHIAHLGGAIIGALWVFLDRKGSIDRMLSSLGKKRTTGSHSAWDSTQREASFYEFSSSKPKKETVDPKFDQNQKDIDAILDKISVSGYASLTENEKRILLDASKSTHPDKGNE